MDREDQFEIPSIIHQIWIQGAAEMPPRYRRWSATWASRNPGWEHRVWDENSLRSLMTAHRPEWWRIYDGQPEMEARADVGRYAVLQALGGVYADMDTVCVRPIGDVLMASSARFQASTYPMPFKKSICPDRPYDFLTNSIMASSPDHLIWNDVLAHLQRHATRHLLMPGRTGPAMLWPIVRNYGERYPGDVRLLGWPHVFTAFYLPRRLMRLRSRFESDLRALDYNDSARRTMRNAVRLSRLPHTIFTLFRCALRRQGDIQF